MKNFKKVLLTGTITLATLLAMSAMSKAATVKVTGEVVNIRKSASTSSAVVAMLSENVECEYLGEEGDWYKIKYQKYTGYVSKQYTKLIGETTSNTQKPSESTNTQTNSEQNNQTSNQNTQTNANQASTQNNTQVNNQTSNQNTQTNNQTNNTNDNQSSNNNSTAETIKLTYKKFNKDTIIRILPLIHSSNIGQAKKNDEVLILAETSGWSYIQTDEISGWVRTDTLGKANTVTTGGSSQGSSGTSSEKIGYISEEYVNMRKGAGTTYSVVKVLKLNAQVTILEESGSWYKVKSGSDTGYVSKELVSDTKKVTSRSSSEPRTEKEDKKEESNTDKDKTTTNKTSSTADKNTTNKTQNTADKNKTNNKTQSTTTSTSNKTQTTTTNKNQSTTSDKTTNKTDKTNTTNKTDTTSNKTNTTTNQNSSSKDTIKGTDVIAYAKKYLGHKYVWAGASPNSFDCSGFTMYVYKHFGVSLPHYTVSQYNSSKGTKITKQSELKMGDIVFLTDYETGAPCGHCGIYISNGDFIHADSSVGYVNISNLNGIYKGRFCGALRINK